jgi:hypothetical protein
VIISSFKVYRSTHSLCLTLCYFRIISSNVVNFLCSKMTEEDILDNSTTQGNEDSPYSQKKCFAMIDKVCPGSPLPYQCTQYEDVKLALQRRNSDKASYAIAFQGMSPGETRDAIAARQSGRLYNAQIQRRLTSNKDRKDRSFFF